MSENRGNRFPVSVPEAVVTYYSRKLEEFGATARGVDWNSEASQRVRFAQLLRLLDEDEGQIALIDYGCGYGALVNDLDDRGRPYDYQGFDPSSAMIDAARQRFGGHDSCRFMVNSADLTVASYTVASGLFNVRLECDVDPWHDYVLQTLDAIDALSLRGFAFNMLTSYSDHDKQRADLYYADPVFFFDYCKRRFSPRVALLHDYPLYEFTILVRK